MYRLYIANKNYSSWSLRPWVLMKELGIPFEEVLRPFELEDNFALFRKFSPSGKVPCLVDDEGGDSNIVVWDSLAIAEYLAEKTPAVWPNDTEAKTFARCAAAEMHSGFATLRDVCPMNCGITAELNEVSPALQRDLERIHELWQEGLDKFGGPFLAGADFTAVDAFFCPVAFRFASYQLPLSNTSKTYHDQLLALPSMQAWEQSALQEPWREPWHEEEIAATGRVLADRRHKK
ncbi:MAG: glutathione S-transferase family protein [Pseudohongiellaceae bacterium]